MSENQEENKPDNIKEDAEEQTQSQTDATPSASDESNAQQQHAPKKKSLFGFSLSAEKKALFRNILYISIGIFVLSVIVNTIISVKLLQGSKKMSLQVLYIPYKIQVKLRTLSLKKVLLIEIYLIKMETYLQKISMITIQV